jgi:hypothetical protein
MEKFKNYALSSNEAKLINGAGRVRYSISIGNPDGSTTITYVWFEDVNNNFTWDDGEVGGTQTVHCPKPYTNEIEP